MLNKYACGDFCDSVKVMEEVAEMYKIPSVNFGYRTALLWKDNLLRFDEQDKKSQFLPLFSKDGVHPLPYGHEIYSGVMREFLEKVLNSKQNTDRESVFSSPGSTHKLVPVYSNYFLPSLNNLTLVHMPYGKDSVFSKTNTTAFVWTDQKLKVKAKGSIFGLALTLLPGKYEPLNIQIDDKKEIKKLTGFGSFSPRLFYCEFKVPNDDQFHEITIYKPDETPFNLIYLLTDGNITSF